MNKKEYQNPSIKNVEMEDLMSVGLNNSVGSGTQLSKETDDMPDDNPINRSVWDEEF